MTYATGISYAECCYDYFILSGQLYELNSNDVTSSSSISECIGVQRADLAPFRKCIVNIAVSTYLIILFVLVNFSWSHFKRVAILAQGKEYERHGTR